MPPLKSVANAINVLKAFAERPEWRLTDLAARLNLPKSVTHRLLQTLVEGELLGRESRTDRYVLGIGIVKLARAAERRGALMGLAHPFLVELSQQSGETATLAILRGERGLCVDTVDGSHAMRYSVQLGDTVHLHSGAIGKALLAFQPHGIIDNILQGPLPRFTDTTIVHPRRLEEALREVRRIGWAFSEGEITAGSRSVAAPIFNADGAAIASLALTAPTVRMADAQVGEYRRLVVAAAATISSGLGYANPGYIERSERDLATAGAA